MLIILEKLSVIILPENMRKPEVFCCFRRVQKEISGKKRVNPFLANVSVLYPLKSPGK